MMTDTKNIILGSGKIYVVEFTGEVPEDLTFETADNELGAVKGGASVEYTPSFYEAKDDLGTVAKKVVTEEEAILKSGVMTWNAKTLAKLSSTAVITEDEESKTRTLKVGGAGRYDGKKYAIRFVHTDAEVGDIRVTIVGNNEAGWELAFAQDAETVINAEFKAMPMDSEGTLIEYKETFKS